MKCNYVKVQRAKWQQEAIEKAKEEGVKEGHEVVQREADDVFSRAYDLIFIACMYANVPAEKCWEIDSELNKYVLPEWERMVKSDDGKIGKGIGDFWAMDKLKTAGYPYRKPTKGEM